MRVDRRLLALIAVVAVIALFIDGFAYVYRLATNQPLTGTIRGVTSRCAGVTSDTPPVFFAYTEAVFG